MNKFLGTFAAFLLASLIHAQITIKGIVTDRQSQPLPGATVMLYINLSKTNTAITGINGDFAFANIAINTNCKIIVQHVGKKTMGQTFIADGSKNLSFTLEDLAYFLEPLEIKAVTAADRAPFTKTDLNAQEIAKNNLGQDIPILLNQTPSLYVSSDAGNGVGYTYMHIRGSDATRINVTLNGIPYNDAESEGTYFVDLPDIVSSVGSIQIQRGAGTSTNGSGAFGATINLSTNEFHALPYAESDNSFGSFNTFKNTIKAGSGLISDHFTFDARLSQISSNGYIDRATSNLQSYYLSAAYINKKTSLRFNLISGKEKTYQAWYGIDSGTLRTDRTFNPAGTEKPGAPYDNETDNYWQTHYQLFLNQSFNDNWSLNVATFLTRGYGYYEEYKGVAAETAAGDNSETSYAFYGLPNPVYGNDTITNTDLVRQLWLDNYFYGQTFSLQYKHNKDELTFGGSWTVYTGKHIDKVIWTEFGGIPKDYIYNDFPAKKTDVNFYAKWLHALNEKWNIFGDIQYRHVMHDMEGFEGNPTLFIDRKFDFVNPKAGISYYYDGWNAYFSYAMANKEPNRDDFQASPQQQPKQETLHDLELGLEKKTTSYNWGITVYDMIYKDQLVLTGKLNDVGNYTRINVPNSYRLGIELQGGYIFNKWMNATANFTLSSNKIKSFTEYLDNYDDGSQKPVQHSNTDISFSPSIISAATVNFLPFKNTELTLLSKYVGKQYLDNTQDNLRMLTGFYTQDVRVSYTIKHLLFNEWNIVGQVNNVFNTMYEPNGATYPYIYGGEVVNSNYYFPMAGTNFMIAVNVKL